MDLNIEEFYQDCAAGLLALYRSFPRRVDLYVADLIGTHEPDEFGLPALRHQHCLGALLWLADEGYLRTLGALRFEALEQAVLTEKALLRLSRAHPDLMPEDVGLPQTVRQQRATLAHHWQAALTNRHAARLVEIGQRLFED